MLPVRFPPSRSPITVMHRPTNAIATAAIVTGVSRSPTVALASNTATSGVSEARNAAFAGVVVFTA